jgi:hypothetical protein
MRITGSELRKIIKEEIARHITNEGDSDSKEFDFSDAGEVIKTSEVPAVAAERQKKIDAMKAKLKAKGIDLDAATAHAVAALFDEE